MSCRVPLTSFILWQIGDRPKFYWCAAAGLMGVIVTLVFIPEITDLDLREGDKRWDRIKTGIFLLHFGVMERAASKDDCT